MINDTVLRDSRSNEATAAGGIDRLPLDALSLVVDLLKSRAEFKNAEQ